MNREQREQAMAREALERHRRIEFERTTSARLDRMESEMERLHRETRAALDAALRRLEAQNGHPHSPKITPDFASFGAKVQSRTHSEG